MARLRLADALLIVGTPGEALEHYQWLAERWPERVEVRLGLGRCRRRLGDADEAVRILDWLLADAPLNGEALWERGQLEVDRDRLAAAETWLRRARRGLQRRHSEVGGRGWGGEQGGDEGESESAGTHERGPGRGRWW